MFTQRLKYYKIFMFANVHKICNSFRTVLVTCQVLMQYLNIAADDLLGRVKLGQLSVIFNVHHLSLLLHIMASQLELW